MMTVSEGEAVLTIGGDGTFSGTGAGSLIWNVVKFANADNQPVTISSEKAKPGVADNGYEVKVWYVVDGGDLWGEQGDADYGCHFEDSTTEKAVLSFTGFDNQTRSVEIWVRTIYGELVSDWATIRVDV